MYKVEVKCKNINVLYYIIIRLLCMYFQIKKSNMDYNYIIEQTVTKFRLQTRFNCKKI